MGGGRLRPCDARAMVGVAMHAKACMASHARGPAPQSPPRRPSPSAPRRSAGWRPAPPPAPRHRPGRPDVDAGRRLGRRIVAALGPPGQERWEGGERGGRMRVQRAAGISSCRYPGRGAQGGTRRHVRGGHGALRCPPSDRCPSAMRRRPTCWRRLAGTRFGWRGTPSAADPPAR